MPALMDKTQLQIGEIAHLSGLPVKTIRYYEELGLLASTVSRSPSGYRLFSTQVINRLSFIRRAQALGLSLHEIGELLSIHDRGELPCGQVKQRLQTRVTAIAEQIRALKTLSTELEGILCAWQDQPPAHLQGQTICPNLQPEWI
jgi:MerR family transcriptional regulator, copper efflux regulator